MSVQYALTELMNCGIKSFCFEDTVKRSKAKISNNMFSVRKKSIDSSIGWTI